MLYSALLVGLLCLTPLHADEESTPTDDGAQDDLLIYLLIGQSNMAGRAALTDDDKGVLPNCYLLNTQDVFEPARQPLNRHSTIRKPLNMQRLNLGGGFATTMLKQKHVPAVGLVVNAKGGTKIEQWKQGTPFYNDAIRRTRAAQKFGTLKGILWHQGEGNAGKPEEYLPQLTTLIANLRKDLNAPDLPFIAGQVFYDAKTKPHTKAINAEIAKLPAAVPSTGVASSENLTTFDNVHFDAQSTNLLGERYAVEMLKVQQAAEPGPQPSSR